MQAAFEILQRYYGYTSFREGQHAIVSSIVKGQDTVGIMPTGGGKSICYQVPALLMPGTTIVISPLISLMKDQVDALTQLGIPAAYINSSLSAAETDQRIQAARAGKYKLLYIAPERLETDRFRSLIAAVTIPLVAIDEAHCLSQWGHDFRPSYLAVAPFLKQLQQRPIVAAFTATATEEVTHDIIRLLELQSPALEVSGFDRANLTLNVLRGVNKRDYVMSYIQEHRDQAGIIYTSTRKEADELHAALLHKKISAGKYHAGLGDEERMQAQESFLYDDIRVMVATNAFGMGIDKSNVRYVLHYNMPKNMEAYYQEAGRAGRDGEPSECVLLFSPQDVQTQKFLIEQSVSAPERKAHDYKKLQTMIDYCYTQQCLRSHILRYFGETGQAQSCDNCSSCLDESETVDITLEAQKICSCIRRMNERFGVTLIAQVLKGSANKRVMEFGFDRLPTYGAMKEYTEKAIADLIHVLIAEGYVALSEGQYPVVRLTQLSVEVLKGNERVLQKIPKKKQALEVGGQALFEELRKLRKQLADRERVPPYVIFADSTLRELSQVVPTSETEMLQIKGVGEAKLRKYGRPFLDLLQTFQA